MSPHDDHTHDHDHDHEGPHPFQPDIEDSPFTPRMLMAQAVEELMIEKGIFTADEMRAQIEMMDSREPAIGARMVAKAWLDPGYKERLMIDVNAASLEVGIDAGPIPIRAVENTPEVHNVIVCTLCSCYPRGLLGFPPDWYKSRAYRSRTVHEPRKVLQEFGLQIADGVEVRVHDSTADMRYMVLPMRPAGTDGWSEEQLAATVSRDSLIGVSVARTDMTD